MIPSLLLVLACTASKPDETVPDSGAPDTGESGDSGDSADTADTGETAAPLACNDIPLPPYTQESLRGFTSSEDFAFTADGWVVGVDQNNNLVAQDIKGNMRVIRPSVGAAAGIRILPGGDIVLASVSQGALQRITPEGSLTTLASGFGYPNGIDLDLDGYVYVSDQNAGTVSRVDPESGDTVVIADGLYNPNGLTFSPDYQTLYVGSFGSGGVYAIDRDDAGGWAHFRVWTVSPLAKGPPLDACPDLPAGTECFLTRGAGVGVCTDHADVRTCDLTLDTAACASLVEGDPCVTPLLGEDVSSRCVPDATSGALFCPKVELERQVACDGVEDPGQCTLGGSRGRCTPTWEGVAACVANRETMTFYQEPCAGLQAGDNCTSREPTGPYDGQCVDGSDLGLVGMYCMPDPYDPTHGGLDGIGTDACGDLYVAEYVTGSVWRFDGEGAEGVLAVDVMSYWIPNIHWGLGVGGFDTDVMYVTDRQHESLHAVAVGVPGRPEAYPGE